MKLIDGVKNVGKPFHIPDCSRTELAEFFKERGYKVGAEIGVLRGEYTETFCKAGLKMFAIDPWIGLIDGMVVEGGQDRQDRNYARSLLRLSPYDCTIIRKTSMDALKDFKDESLDFIYIDGNHTFPFAANDIFEWAKKVKPGGVISGHDYLNAHPLIDNEEIHVKAVVDAYTALFDLDFYTFGNVQKERTLSWMFFKKSEQVDMTEKEKGIIYYTDNRAREFVLLLVQRILNEISKERDLSITSVSLKPIKFGHNIVLENRERSYPTMVRQIVMALENSPAKNVFFCENDVLYHPSHFDFTPPKDNVFYYNSNVWRWRLWDDHAIRYDKMWPLSCLCCNREFALEHYKMRERKIIEWGENEFRSREPRRARIWGYEPGTKLKRRGGLTNDVAESWYSEFPNIDMRHARTFSRLKCTPEDFTHAPENWEEIDIFDIPGWNLEELLGEEQLKYIRETCTKW
jgi:hypothetical protein